jgi:serine/threonine-protein kinase
VHVQGDPPQRSARKATRPLASPPAAGTPSSVVDEGVAAVPLPADGLAVGTQISHRKVLDIVECIGEGGMGRIYRAYDPTMDRYVALKMLKSGVPEVVRSRFHREAVIAANFSHPNLPRVLDVGSVPEQQVQWLTMEYLRGRDLGQVIERGKGMPLPLLVDIYRQTLDALEYIHTRRIVHCDVKPDNIFITRDAIDRRIVIVKLIDFGVARRLDPPVELQLQLIGDPLYMAPEQTVLNGPLDGRADLYALAISFYESLTGRHPFQEHIDKPARELLRIQCEDTPPPPSRFLPPGPPKVRGAIDETFARACAKEPDDRYPDARALKKALGALLEV